MYPIVHLIANDGRIKRDLQMKQTFPIKSWKRLAENFLLNICCECISGYEALDCMSENLTLHQANYLIYDPI